MAMFTLYQLLLYVRGETAENSRPFALLCCACFRQEIAGVTWPERPREKVLCVEMLLSRLMKLAMATNRVKEIMSSVARE